jgi:AraC-like DNA-binding protein
VRWRADAPAQALGGAVAEGLGALGRAWARGRGDEEAAAGVVGEALGLLGASGHVEAARLDGRVARALGRVCAQPTERWPLGALAREVGWSPTWLARRFHEEVGLPLRPYLLWRRLMVVAALAARGGEGLAGAGVAALAARAGFSDHAHLTRTMRRMLGRAPRELVR